MDDVGKVSFVYNGNLEGQITPKNSRTLLWQILKIFKNPKNVANIENLKNFNVKLRNPEENNKSLRKSERSKKSSPTNDRNLQKFWQFFENLKNRSDPWKSPISRKSSETQEVLQILKSIKHVWTFQKKISQNIEISVRCLKSQISYAIFVVICPSENCRKAITKSLNSNYNNHFSFG